MTVFDFEELVDNFEEAFKRTTDLDRKSIIACELLSRCTNEFEEQVVVERLREAS